MSFNKEKVYFYIRVSTDEQAEFGYSIDMQQNQCAKFADMSGLKLIRTYIDDGYTAKNMKRPQLLQMLTDIKKEKGLYAIVVWRLDRLCRNTDDYHATFKKLFSKYGVELLSATENNDMSNPYNRYMRNLQINNAELESNLTSIRTIANMREKARQGYYPGHKPPVGYTRKIINKINTCVIDWPVAKYVKKIIDLYCTGVYSYSDIARIMREEGFIYRNKHCTKKMVENILTLHLKFYIGKFDFSGESYDGKHEALISKETYLLVKKIREQHSSPKIQKHSFLYRGLIKCPESGRVLTAETHKGANKSGTYVYYRCARNCQNPSNCKCMIREDSIDKAVKDVLCSLSITPEKLKELKSEFKYMLKYQEEFDENKKTQLAAQITKLRTRLNNLYEDKLDGIVSNETYFKKKEEWEVSLEEKTLEYSSLSKTNIELIKQIEKMSELLENLYEHYLQLPDEKKRILLKLLCPNFFYDGSKIVITIKRAFETLFKFALFENGAGGGIRTHA